MLHARMLDWQPAGRPAAAPRSPLMAQTVPQAPSSLDKVMGDPKLALATDLAAAGVGGLILYNYLKGKHQPFIGLWVAVTTAAVVKAFHDGSRL